MYFLQRELCGLIKGLLKLRFEANSTSEFLKWCIWPGTDYKTWWRHQIETFSALLAICAGNSPVTGEFPAQRPVTRSFDVVFDLRLNKRLSKQSWGWWTETPSRPLWRHSNENVLQHRHHANQNVMFHFLCWQLWSKLYKNRRFNLDDIYRKWPLILISYTNQTYDIGKGVSRWYLCPPLFFIGVFCESIVLT